MEDILGTKRIGYTDLLNLVNNGAFQESLAKWYLHLIETRIDVYLLQNGFDQKAIPKDYNVHPQNIQTLKNNSQILSSILDPQNENLSSTQTWCVQSPT
ncbi:hypothetical protein EIN_375970, partial [Entamoeba invadens IP1]